jgi:hypothetical protein
VMSLQGRRRDVISFCERRDRDISALDGRTVNQIVKIMDILKTIQTALIVTI